MVAEMHGVWASGKDATPGKWVEISQIGTDRISLHYEYTGKSPLLTAEQARYLASKLNRLARRLEAANA